MTTYNFIVKRGDTYNGAIFTITRNTAPLNLTGAHVLCQFKKSATLASALTWTELSGISILQTIDNNKLQFNPQIINIPSGDYIYDVQITLANLEVKTYISGTMTVLEDISRG